MIMFFKSGLPSLQVNGINPVVTNGLSHPYHLDETIFIFRGIRSNFSFLFHISMKIIIANRIAQDATPRFAAAHLVLFFLPMSHKKDARLIWFNSTSHYTNMPMQYVAIFEGCKNDIFLMKTIHFLSYFLSKYRLRVHVRTALMRFC